MTLLSHPINPRVYKLLLHLAVLTSQGRTKNSRNVHELRHATKLIRIQRRSRSRVQCRETILHSQWRLIEQRTVASRSPVLPLQKSRRFWGMYTTHHANPTITKVREPKSGSCLVRSDICCTSQTFLEILILSASRHDFQIGYSSKLIDLLMGCSGYVRVLAIGWEARGVIGAWWWERVSREYWFMRCIFLELCVLLVCASCLLIQRCRWIE